VHVQGAAKIAAGVETCTLELDEAASGRAVGSVEIKNAEFKDSIIFFSRQKIVDPVEFAVRCVGRERSVVKANLALGELTDWRHVVDLGVIVVD